MGVVPQNKLYHKGLAPDVVTYSILIRALCKEGRMEKATDLLFKYGGKWLCSRCCHIQHPYEWFLKKRMMLQRWSNYFIKWMREMHVMPDEHS